MITEDVSHLSLDTKVERVASFLDEDKPGWPSVLIKAYGDDLATLYVSSPWACVLSAVYRNYPSGWDALIDNGLGAYGDAIACMEKENDDVRASWLKAVTSRK